MNLKNLFWNSYWAIIGILTGIFCLISKNPLIILVPLIAIFAVNTFVGNIFVVRTVWRIKSTFSILITFLLIFYIEHLLDLKDISLTINTVIVSLISVSVIITTLIKESAGLSITLIVSNWKKVKAFFVNYLLKFNFGTVFGWIVEIALIIAMIQVLPSSLTKVLMIIFWILSGPLFVMLRATSFVIKEELEDVMAISQIYGTSRVTYFLLLFLPFESQLSWLEFGFLFSLMYLGFMGSLMPYITRSKELKNTFEVLRYVYSNRRDKVNQISAGTDVDSPKETRDILNRLSFHRFVESNDEGKRWSIHRVYKKLAS